MKKDRKKRRGLDGGSEFFNLFLIQRRIFPSPRVSREKLDGFTAPDIGPFNHLWKPTSNGNMEPKPHQRPLKKAWLEVTIKYVNPTLFVKRALNKYFCSLDFIDFKKWLHRFSLILKYFNLWNCFIICVIRDLLNLWFFAWQKHAFGLGMRRSN